MNYMEESVLFDKLIHLIYSKKMGIKVNTNSKEKHKFIPKVYYIGDGKTGSTSIMNGFPDINVAHWHNVYFFEKIYETKLLTSNNYDLYDLIIYIGKKYNFKPVIIESIRNTINAEISSCFQHIRVDRNCGLECEICKIKKHQYDNDITSAIEVIKKNINSKINKMPYSCEMFKKHFNLDLSSTFDKKLGYYFKDTNNIFLLVLKFENIKKWNEIINNHLPYKFLLKHDNKTVNKFYERVKKNIKFTKKEFQPILDSYKINSFYSNDEINKITKILIK